MPIPKPNAGESRQDFINRCMGDKTMEAEYTDNEQRLAVCNTSYDSKENVDAVETQQDNTEDQKHIRNVQETEDSYVIEFGKSMPEENQEDEQEKQDTLEVEPEYVEIQTEIKAYQDDEEKNAEEGMFEGYGSVFNNTDLGNDVIRTGAFKKSLKKRGPKGVKLLYQHKSDMPIGVFDEIKEDQHGLKVKGRLALKTQAGRDAFELMKMGALDGLSIGFKPNPKAVHYDKRTKKRVIEEVELMEISLVTFPMNPEARVRSVKGEDLSIREWENGMRDAFNLSRSEAKMAAKAVHQVFEQREVAPDTELVDAINNLTIKLNSWRKNG